MHQVWKIILIEYQLDRPVLEAPVAQSGACVEVDLLDVPPAAPHAALVEHEDDELAVRYICRLQLGELDSPPSVAPDAILGGAQHDSSERLRGGRQAEEGERVQVG